MLCHFGFELDQNLMNKHKVSMRPNSELVLMSICVGYVIDFVEIEIDCGAQVDAA